MGIAKAPLVPDGSCGTITIPTTALSCSSQTGVPLKPELMGAGDALLAFNGIHAIHLLLPAHLQDELSEVEAMSILER